MMGAAGFDFGQIGSTLSRYMDTDLMDIRRDVDGSLVEVYSNIPCHIAYMSVDNPNPETVDIKPIIQNMSIHMELWVDIRNNDFVIAKKMGSDGSLLAVYNGRCGNPVVSQGRKKAMVTMSSTESEDVTPIPPSDPVQVTVRYVSEGEDVNPATVQNVERGRGFVISAPVIDGYDFSYSIVDGMQSEYATVRLEAVEYDMTIDFVYTAKGEAESFAFLVKGLYTRNDGTLASGWHTYRSVPIRRLGVLPKGYRVVCDNVSFEHEDNGRRLSIEDGAQIVIFPQKVFCTIENVEVSEWANFDAVKFTPSAEQESFYRTRWYD